MAAFESTWVREIPVEYFRFEQREFKERLRVNQAITAFLDDFAETEASCGKALSKVGALCAASKPEWLPGFSSILDNVLRSSSVLKSKQHQSMAQTMSQSISKSFPEFVKSCTKRSQLISSKVQSSVEEFRKAKASHQKNLEKYVKLIQETEGLIKSREAAMESESKDSTDKDSGGFMNRSFTKVKMLAKLTPEDNVKRMTERAKDLIRELDLQESSLMSSASRLSDMQFGMKDDVYRAMIDLRALEESRLQFLQDAVSKLYVALDLQVSRAAENSGTLVDQANTLNAESEISSFLWTVDQAVDAAGTFGPLAEIDGGGIVDVSECSDLFLRIEKLLEALEYIRSIAQRTCMGLLETAESDKAYSRSTLKALEKHGFSKFTPMGENGGATNRHKSIAVTVTQSCGELLGSIESPSTRFAWEATARAWSSLMELKNRSADVYVNEISTSLESLALRVQESKRLLGERKASNLRIFESVVANTVRLTQRLNKVQSTLKERRSTLKRAKEDVTSASGAPQPSAALNLEGALSPMPPLGEPLAGYESETNAPQTAAPDGGDAATNRNSGSAPAGFTMKQGFEKMRSTKLSVAMGLETPLERITRIEAKIVSLEEEERDLTAAVNVASLSLDAAKDSTRKDILNALNTAKEAVCEEVLSLKKIIVSSIVDWEKEYAETVKSIAHELKGKAQEVDVVGDTQVFVDSFRSLGAQVPESSLQGGDFVCSTDLAPVSVFEPIRNETIEEERKAQKLPPPPTLSSTPPSSKSYIESANPQILSDEVLPDDGSVVGTPSKLNRQETVIADATETSFGEGSEMPRVPSSESDGVDISFVAAANNDTEAQISPDTMTATSVPAVAVTSMPGQASPPVVQAKVVRASTRVNAVSPGKLSDLMADIVEVEEPKKAKSLQVNDNASGAQQPQQQEGDPGSRSSLAAKPLPSAAKEPENELARFGLSPNDRVLESFSCALYPRKGILTHGRMFVTQNYIAFQGWPDTRVLLPFERVSSVEKMNTLYYIPNAISIKDCGQEEFFFGSFIDRDLCFELLMKMLSVSKRLVELHGRTQSSRPLLIGLQKDGISDLLLGINSEAAAAANAAVATMSEEPNLTEAATVVAAPSSLDADSKSKDAHVEEWRHSFDGSETSDNSSPRENRSPSGEEKVYAPTSALEVRSNATAVTATSVSSATSLPAQAATERPLSESEIHALLMANECDEPEDGVNLSSLFSHRNIVPLATQEIPGSVRSVWRSCWLEGSGYGDFLTSQGDLDVAPNEWREFSGSVPEDISHLKFTYSRPFSYAHPRTTMLMFGPKNAPAKQTHYLYIYGMGAKKDKTLSKTLLSTSSSDADVKKKLRRRRLKRGVVLTITQFDGIPMADTFKVLHYWCFERDPNDLYKTIVRVGVHVHFIKSTLLRGQVASGVRDELAVLSQQWLSFAALRVALAASTDEDLLVDVSGRERSKSIETVHEHIVTADADIVVDRRVETYSEAPGKVDRQAEESQSPRRPSIQRRPSVKEIMQSVNQLSGEATAVRTVIENKGYLEDHVSHNALVLIVFLLLLLVVVQWFLYMGLRRELFELTKSLKAVIPKGNGG